MKNITNSCLKKLYEIPWNVNGINTVIENAKIISEGSKIKSKWTKKEEKLKVNTKQNKKKTKIHVTSNKSFKHLRVIPGLKLSSLCTNKLNCGLSIYSK